MKAAIFEGAGKPLTIGDIPSPDPGPHELVLKVKACGICGSDLHCTEHGPFTLPEGSVMGHEFSGEVVGLGTEVQGRFAEGERVTALPVIIPPIPPVGLEDAEPWMRPDMQPIGLGQVPGAYAEYVRVGVTQTRRLPENVSFEQGALVEPLAVGLHAVNRAEMRSGDNVLVLGAGPIGLASTAFALRMGAANVVVSEMTDQRRALAESVGATATIDARGNVLEQFAEKAGALMPDVVIEAVGVPGMVQQAVDFVKPRGRVVVVGVCQQQDQMMPMVAIMKEVGLQFVLGYEPRDWDTVLSFIASDRLRVDHLVTDRVGFDAFPDAFEALRTPSTQCKVMLKPE
ncbi:zinc-binding dehydrogenase [Pyruvatibacter mobilis]|uniref:zinc-binding dehydrogenase n=1 Tax=Pyruvatibacter mobilis TaxID=1712261 RepID=UPI003BAD8E99